MPADAVAPSGGASDRQHRIEQLEAELRAERDRGLLREAAVGEIFGTLTATLGNPRPVFDVILDKAMQLCGALFGELRTYDGERFLLVATRGVPASYDDYYRRNSGTFGPGTGPARILAGEAMVHMPDLIDTEAYRRRDPDRVALVELGGARASLVVPLRRGRAVLGYILIYRKEAVGFSEQQIALLQNFAATAVIALENARLFADQREALEQQTATADILRVISQSRDDIQPVLDAIARAALRFCGAEDAVIVLRDGDHWQARAHAGPMSGVQGVRIALTREMTPGLVILDRSIVHRPNRAALSEGDRRVADRMGFNALLAAPMLRDEFSVGAIVLHKRQEGEFTPRQVELLQSFAAQAVIALENTRLFTELGESLEQQTATAEILGVISRSPTNIHPVLDAIAKAALRFCGAEDATITLREGSDLVIKAHEGNVPGNAPGTHHPFDRLTVSGRSMIDVATVHLPDVLAADPAEFSGAHQMARQFSFRAVVGAPLVRDGNAIGCVVLRKLQPVAFSPRQIELLEGFAAQAVIALENTRLFTELGESLEQQTATSQILGVISRSPTDVQPVLDAVAKAAVRFCGAEDALISLRDGDEWFIAGHEGPISHGSEHRPLNRGTAVGRAMLDGKTHHLPDVDALDPAEFGTIQEFARREGFKAALAAPLLREGVAVGTLSLRRSRPGAFSPRQIELLESFAAQSVIALENTRLFTELRESLEQQTASADVLRAIAQLRTDVQPVLDAVVRAARRFCGAEDATISLSDGAEMTIAAHDGQVAGQPVGTRHPLDRSTSRGRSIIDASTVHVPDMLAPEAAEFGLGREIAREFGFRAIMSAPMLRDGRAIGCVTLRKAQAVAFTTRQVDLLQSFAAQAVIAIENVRLLSELRQRTDDLTESLDYQTATSEVLNVISRSAEDVQPVLDAMLAAALRLCGAETGGIAVRRGERMHFVATAGQTPEFERHLLTTAYQIDRSTAVGRVVLERAVYHDPDIAADPTYTRPEASTIGHQRAVLGVPLMRQGEALGVIIVSRAEPVAFSERQVGLIKTFADQAVIAMENTRLLSELRLRTDDLTQSLEYQTATSELLEVVSRSASDIQPVLDTILGAAKQLCDVQGGVIAVREGDVFRFKAVSVIGRPEFEQVLRERRLVPGGGSAAEWVMQQKQVCHVADTQTDTRINFDAAKSEFRTVLGVPMLRDDELLGVIVLTREKVDPFSERQIGLIKTFADQAVIAIENARLLSELRERTDDLTESLEYQTATSDVLKVISRSTFDLQPVLDTLAETVARLCDAGYSAIFRRDGDAYRVGTTFASTEQTLEAARNYKAYLEDHPLTPGRGSMVGRVALTGKAAHVDDTTLDPEYTLSQAASLGHLRTQLGVPLMREGDLIGVLIVARQRVEPFSERQIELVHTFADQAVIAMENARLLGELRESLEQQTATADVLRVINASPGELAPVFTAMLEKAMHLCEAAFGTLWLRDGDIMTVVGVPAVYQEFLDGHPVSYGQNWGAPGTVPARILAGETEIHVEDLAAEAPYLEGNAHRRALVDLGGARSALAVALVKDGAAIGYILIYRQEVRRFDDKQAALLKNFAAQAVIAVENARLLGELRQRTDDLTESLEYQTATSELLEVISRSAANIQPVLDTMLTSAERLCAALAGTVAVRQGDVFRRLAVMGYDAETEEALRAQPVRPGRDSVSGRVLLEKQVVHIPDLAADPEFAVPELVRFDDLRTTLGVPLLRDGEPIGVIAVTRDRVEPFTERQIALVKTFADQAVIAMENARLLSELRQSLDQQTATSEVLRTISRSSTDLEGVLETLVETVARLCRADQASMFRRRDALNYLVAAHGYSEEAAEFMRAHPPELNERTLTGRVVKLRQIVHIPDVLEDKNYDYGELQGMQGYRTMLGIPLMAQDNMIGLFIVMRTRVDPFTDKEIALASGFADQAVIAIENARLFEELRERTDDLTQSLEYQTATSELLEVISRSRSDLQPVLDTLLASAARLCGTNSGGVALRRGNGVSYVASFGQTPEFDKMWREREFLPDQTTVTGRVLGEKRVVHVRDMAADTEHSLAEAVTVGGKRTALGVPLLREGEPIGVIMLNRDRVEPFSERQIALVRTFADQAVIAVENARLLGELSERTDDLTESLEYQTATSELLEVISRSTSNVQPVLDTMLASATKLCGTKFGAVAIRQGHTFRHVATLGFTPEFDQELRNHEFGPSGDTLVGRTLNARQVVLIDDVASDPDYRMPEVLRFDAIRTALGVPLMRGGEPIGVIVVSRDRVEPFSERQIALVRTFADQAVIAMENARLLGELRESLEQQTATSDVLRTISRSSTNLEGVLETLVETVARLCRADQAYMLRRQDNLLHMVTAFGVLDEARRWMVDHPFEMNDTSLTGRVARLRHMVHIPDVLADPGYAYAGQQIAGFRTLLGIPLLREDALLGVFAVARTHVEPFSDKEIALASGFADQAVIAIENARLFEELRDRQAELRATFDNMGDGVVMFDADQRLAAWNRNFQELLDMPDDFLATRPTQEDYVRLLVARGEIGDRDPDKEVARYRDRASRKWSAERTRPDGRTLEVRNNPMPGGGAVLIYGDITRRKKAEAEIAAARDAAEAALERQTATADILKVIASSPSDTQPAFDAVADSAKRLLGGHSCAVWRFEGDKALLQSFTRVSPEADAALQAISPISLAENPLFALVRQGDVLRIPDTEAEEFAVARDAARGRGFRSGLFVPLIAAGQAIGFIGVTRKETGPFADEDVQLLQTFAAQSVIAIQNARLFNDLRESLEQQTASAEILQAISQSPTDVQPVLDAVVKAAVRFCGATDAIIQLRDGDVVFSCAHDGPLTYSPGTRRPLDGSTAGGRAVVDVRTWHCEDVETLDPIKFDGARALAKQHGFRAMIAAPLAREGAAIGAVVLRKVEPGPFSARQTELLESFAAQAVIAIENVRLFTELRESLEQQTASAEILQVISQSPTDVQPVLDVVSKAALRFCGATDALIALRDGDEMRIASHEGPFDAWLGSTPLNRGRALGRTILEAKTIHFPDIKAYAAEYPETLALAETARFHAGVSAPMVREGIAIGGIALRKAEAGPFTPRQIQLLEAFAAQAVIAIQNVRLFTELREALEQQTASGEILQVISESPTDVRPVLRAVVKAAVRFCGADDASLILREGDHVHFADHEGPLPSSMGERHPMTDRTRTVVRVIEGGETVHIPDLQKADRREFAQAMDLNERYGIRAMLGAPMLREGAGVGCLLLRKRAAGPFTARQIELLETFAAQAVIAIENVRLFTELRQSLERLKAAQANLIQSEKMASLGQLTAGIAHEIKNPLNFVNNFASLSNELLDELRQTVEALLTQPDEGKRADLQETLDLLSGNLSKIVEHGRRADGIVRSMLSHSRGGSGDWQASNVNTLVEEALNLAYHGARAQDKDFNVTLERDFAPETRPIEIVPQDVTRVFLNLIGNGFYAANKRRQAAKDASFRPTLRVATRDLDEEVEVMVRDNGIGITPEIREKLFQPFFTTKPTGEGTGLGLSISYDIVTQQHGGSIAVESEPGQFTEFTVRLPRARRLS
jgi:GAF domain-containing protein